MLKKFFPVLLTLGLLFILLYVFDKIYYRDEVYFLCPIDLAVKRIFIRHDKLGDGHFGANRNNGRSHKGLDILAPVGTPVRAAKSGWAFAYNDPGGYGNFVKIVHSRDFVTMYAHLRDVNFKWIKKVKQGENIGSVGKTGNADFASIRPHLHFEVRKDGVAQNPMKGYLK